MESRKNIKDIQEDVLKKLDGMTDLRLGSTRSLIAQALFMEMLERLYLIFGGKGDNLGKLVVMTLIDEMIVRTIHSLGFQTIRELDADDVAQHEIGKMYG